MFLFPSSATVRNAAARLLETGFDVSFFCPEKLDLEVAQNLIFDLNILAKEQARIRGSDAGQAFTVEKSKNLRDCDIIGKHSAAGMINLNAAINKIISSPSMLGYPKQQDRFRLH